MDAQVSTEAVGILDVSSPRWMLCFHTIACYPHFSSEEMQKPNS